MPASVAIDLGSPLCTAGVIGMPLVTECVLILECCPETGGASCLMGRAGHSKSQCDLSNVPFGMTSAQNVVMTLLPMGRARMLEMLLPTIDRWSGRNSQPTAPTHSHLTVGELGEQAAYFHLRKQGRMVVARRWRSSRQPGDLDMVTWEGDILCFVEVKARSSHDIATAESAVDADKRRMIRRMARLYVAGLREQPRQVRFDIVSIYFNDAAAAEIRVITGAFGWTEPAHRWN